MKKEQLIGQQHWAPIHQSSSSLPLAMSRELVRQGIEEDEEDGMLGAAISFLFLLASRSRFHSHCSIAIISWSSNENKE